MGTLRVFYLFLMVCLPAILDFNNIHPFDFLTVKSYEDLIDMFEKADDES